MRKTLSILFYHLGHFADRLLWFNSPTYEWVEDKLADLYQWFMRQSIKYDEYNEIWQYDNQITR